MKRLLLIDFNNLLHRGFSIHEHLSFAGRSTGGAYGFINQLATLLSNYTTAKIIVCSDSPPYFRSKKYPEYKQMRKKQKDPERSKLLAQNRQITVDFLDLMNIEFWQEKGLEADDLIAAACKEYHEAYDQIIIASNDDDLYQLFKYKNVYCTSKKGNKDTGLYGLEDFERDYPDLTLRDWIKYLAMKGTHNDLPGIKGIGEKTAMRIIKDGTYKQTYKEHKEVLKLFKSLIKLPYPYDYKIPLPDSSGFNERKLMRFLAGLGIEYSGHMKKSFTILNGG